MTENHFTNWTLTDRAKFIKLKIEGKSNKEIASIFKRTDYAIGSYTKQLIKKGYLIIVNREGNNITYRGVTASEFEKMMQKRVNSSTLKKKTVEKTTFKSKLGQTEKSFAVKESKHTVSNPITHYQGGLIIVNNKLYKEVESL